MEYGTDRIDRLHQLTGEVEEELGFLEDAKGRTKLLSLDCILQHWKEDLICSMTRD